MSDWTPEKIARLRQWIAADGFPFNSKMIVTDALDEIERLRSRLELDAFTDGNGNPVPNSDGRLDAYDGIACRDATIKLQDAEIERLEARLQEARAK